MASGSERPGRPMGSLRSRPPRRLANESPLTPALSPRGEGEGAAAVSPRGERTPEQTLPSLRGPQPTPSPLGERVGVRGSSKSTPEVSGEPISKMSGSSIARPRLPVNVCGSPMVSTLTGTNSFGISTMENLAQRAPIDGDIVFSCHFGRGNDDKVRKRCIVWPKPARGNAAYDAAVRQLIDDFRARLRRLDGKLVEEMRRDNFDAGNLRQRVRQHHRARMVQAAKLAEPCLAEKRQMRRKR